MFFAKAANELCSEQGLSPKAVRGCLTAHSENS